MQKTDERGHSADHPIAIPAGVASYGFLALVRVLGALVLTYGLVLDPPEIVRQFASVAPTLPGDVAKLFEPPTF